MIRMRVFATAMAGMCIAFGAAAAVAADAQMRDAGMEAGLTVDYYYGDLSYADEVVECASRKSSALGDPLPNLDFRGGDGLCREYRQRKSENQFTPA